MGLICFSFVSNLSEIPRSQSEVLRRKILRQRARFIRSTFDWAVCSEPLARLRRTRDYGFSILTMTEQWTCRHRAAGAIRRVQLCMEAMLTKVDGPDNAQLWTRAASAAPAA